LVNTRIIRAMKLKKIRNGRSMWHVWGRTKMHTGLCWVNLKEGDHLEDLRVDGRVILKLILKKYDGRAWTGFNWLRIVRRCVWLL